MAQDTKIEQLLGDEKYLKILRMIAMVGRRVNYKEVCDLFKKVKVQEPREIKNFLIKCIECGICYNQKEMYYSNYYFYLNSLWPKLMSSLSASDYQKLESAVKSATSYNTDKYLLDFTHAFVLYTKGRPWQHALKNDRSYYWFDDSPSVRQLILVLGKAGTYDDFLLNLTDRYIGNVYDCFSYLIPQSGFNPQFENRIDRLLTLLVSNSDIEKKAQLLKDKMLFYTQFVKQGDGLCTAQLEPGGFYFYAVAAVKFALKKEYNNAFKEYQKLLKHIDGNMFDDPFVNFFYVLTLLNSTYALASNKLTNLKKNMDEVRRYNPEVYALMMCYEDSTSVEGNDCLVYRGPITSEIMVASVLKHYNLSFIEDDWLKKAYSEVLKSDVKLLMLIGADDIEQFKEKKDKLVAELCYEPPLPKFINREKWEIVLDKILQDYSSTSTSEGKTSVAKERIIYQLYAEQDWTVQPRLQKSKDGISWSAGRNIALNKFAECQIDGMTEQDRRVADAVRVVSSGYWGGSKSYVLRGLPVMLALVNNPNVYDEEGHHIDVVSDKLQMVVQQKKGVFNFELNINWDEVKEGYYVKKESPTLIKVINVGNVKRETFDDLSRITVPAEGKEKMTQLLTHLSKKIVVMSDLLADDENVVSKRAQSKIVAQFQPHPKQGMISCSLLVKPLEKAAIVCKPGKGMELVAATIDGVQVQAKRNLKTEKENYAKIEPIVMPYDFDEYENQWVLEPKDCLEVLDALREMSKHCIIEWPEGERYAVKNAPLSMAGLKLSIHSASRWFELDGEVQVSESKKIKLAKLLELIENSNGQFIQIGDKEYVKIASDLRKHIDTISRISSVQKGKAKVSAFNALQLEGLEVSGIEVVADEAYHKMINRISNAQSQAIKVPKNLNAELRSYQEEGFKWMTRLAGWGAGALLADDMGLGKTVQTIAMLLSRADKGPQLVVVPTSLVVNWQEEIARFAPSLNVKILNIAAERGTLLESASKFDIVLTTYGLLINEENSLKKRQWTTIVLDEAHTIKNRDTKMSKVAMQLDADFRLLLTGTPLQNHVSEMWNLMQFANPNLLGSFNQFAERFLMPIERDGDKESQHQLKRIISPFILRRVKGDVLNELPQKTEITLKVDLSEEEWAYYETLRQKALLNIEEKENTPMQTLAEITRLRQAACNTRLVESKLKLKSSKMDCFMGLVENLMQNNHRALVFSQFTSHLALVKERLEEAGIEYLYLDGATTTKERLRLVEEFQHGTMPLFLISLKAGGLGLNLTAADYVVHLDPWWNPAIEDQASDRAYRIGQQKPVTVYRLIASGTIEEKIIDLHKTKQNLADALLEGGDMSARMSKEEMLALLKDSVG